MAALDVACAVERYGGFTLQLEFTAAAGEVLGVIGPNGAGKTTLLNALSGLVALTSGHLRLGSQTLDEPTRRVFVPTDARRVGVLFQNYRLFPHLTVGENVAFGPRCAGRPRRVARAIAQSWLDRLGIGELIDRKPGQLSGGQAQRVAVARALAAEPAMLLLDEPLAALDALTRLQVRAELRGHLAEFAGPTLLVTHDPLEAMVMTDRLLVVEDGRLVQTGTPAEVARRPATRYIASLVGLNLYRGQVAAAGQVHLDSGASLFTTAGLAAGSRALIAIRPTAISLHSSEPHNSSPRNVWRGRVMGLEPLIEPGRLRVQVAGDIPALVDVTAAAAAELELVKGSEVWLTAKATELDAYPEMI